MLTSMTVDDARKELRAWLEDLAALKAFSDPNSSDAAEFNAAWDAALKKAKDVARQYAETVGG
jgi:hypothetical protein